MMKKKIIILFFAVISCTLAASCNKNKVPTSNSESLADLYLAADYNKTINLTVDYSFGNENGNSANHADSCIKICGNKMSFETKARINATEEDDPIENTITAYVDNDTLYYNVNGSKVKQSSSVKQAMYMLGVDIALFDESYCDSINYTTENNSNKAEYVLNPDKVISNWEETFYTLYNGLGVMKEQISSVESCTVNTVVTNGKLDQYVIDFKGTLDDNGKDISASYRMQMDFSDYGNTSVDVLDELESYQEQNYDAQYNNEDLTEDFAEDTSK